MEGPVALLSRCDGEPLSSSAIFLPVHLHPSSFIIRPFIFSFVLFSSAYGFAMASLLPRSGGRLFYVSMYLRVGESVTMPGLSGHFRRYNQLSNRQSDAVMLAAIGDVNRADRCRWGS